jgi:hypothetical protein
VHFAQPATVTAFDGGGAPVATATMTAPQQVPETLTLAASAIATVVIESPADEVLLTRLCHQTG